MTLEVPSLAKKAATMPLKVGTLEEKAASMPLSTACVACGLARGRLWVGVGVRPARNRPGLAIAPGRRGPGKTNGATFLHHALRQQAVQPRVHCSGLSGFISSDRPASCTARRRQLVGQAAPVVQDVPKIAAIWAVEGALLVGMLCVLAFAWKPVKASFAEGSKSAIGGALLASANTASEYGFGAVIAALPGFLVVANALSAIPDPLVNEAVTVTSLAGITGSASGGMSIALAAMADSFIANANAAGIPMEVLHRVAAMASGGMDTLPHNGAVITLLAVTGLTHRQSYKDIFAITMIKTMAVFVVIGVYYATA